MPLAFEKQKIKINNNDNTLLTIDKIYAII